MSRIKLGIVSIFIALFSFAVAIEAATTTPMYFTLRMKIALQLGGELNGRHRVNVKIIGTNTVWQEEFTNVLFVNSQCSILIGGGRVPLTVDNLRGSNPRVEVTLPEVSAATPLRFPLPSTAYAIQARVAEEVKSVDASVISGAFTSTVNIQNSLVVNSRTLIVDGRTGRVAIATSNISNSAYALNVGGAVNATSFTVNGENLENALSWRISDGNLYYRDGFVGIATSNPKYALDIQGTLNARAILINQRDIKEELQDQLSWKRNGTDIYFDEGIIADAGFVGIGTSTPQEKLDVRGGLRIGPWVSRSGENPQEGTIQYVESGSRGDFQGYTREGWKSLIGIQGGGTPNRLVYWTGSTELGSASNLYWDETKGLLGVGLGSGTPNARLDVKGASTGEALLEMRNSNNQSILHVGQRYVGIGKRTPQFPLDVNGVVNASGYKLNGSPLNLSLSSGSFWQLENERRLYYDLGNVGIGTATPRNLLEISSSSANPSITFDIEDEDLFTMGIDRLNPSAFVISQGGDLSRPIFSFFGDRIGVGTNRPTANLHVSGNSGMVVEGRFGAPGDLPSVGAGTKLLWIPQKAAFRVGRVFSNKWDAAKLGDYSVAMGYDPEASGIGSVVGGGVSNTASGNYSVVPGGFNNRAAADFSFAAGHNAFARHRGAFVWSDYQPSVNAFQSSQPNQFLIRASGGVGIGTSDTSESVLTIAKNRQQSYLMKAIGNNGNVGMVITTSGNVGFGTTNPGTSGLAVMNGRVGIGTTDPTANLHLVGNGTGNLMFAVSAKNQRNSTASILINDQGLVAIGYTLGHVFDSGKALDVNGAVIGKSFAVETEDGIVLLTPSPGSPWSQPRPEKNNVTFYNLGNVGIGTATPNSLLELSNQNVSGNAPYITFDINNRDITTMGPTRNSSNQWLFAIHSGSTVGKTPPIVIGSKNVGIGIGLRTPIAPLHVSGNMVLNGKLAVGTTNFGTYAMNVGGALNVSNIFVNGRSVLPLPVDPWSTSGSNIYFTAGNVGIGTSSGLTSRLVVNGTVSTNKLVMNNEFRLNGDLVTSRLKLLDNAFNSGTVSGSIRINQGNLQYINPSGNLQILSSPLKKGTGTSGNISYFVDSTHLGVTDIFWNSTGPKLGVSGNLLTRRRVIDNGVDITSTVSIGASDSILVQSRLNHDGNLSSVKSFSAEKINLNILKNWGNINSQVNVVGMDILLRSLNNSFFLNNASAIGLRVNVASVNANVAEGGSKYAALFLGGNVGIGTEAPTTELEVVGTVSANFFTLSGGLNVPEININGSTLVARSVDGGGSSVPRIGIGITNPEVGNAELQVKGTVSANSVIVTGGLIATTVNISNGSTSTLFINASGNIGIGTTAPDGQIVLRKNLNSSTEAYLGEKIQVAINGAQPGNRFFFNRDITGFDVRLSSAVNNQLSADATGMKIDFRNLNAVNQSKITGLHVDVSGRTGTRYAAVFSGGRVGIGTTRPSADLHVAGDIIAKNLFLEGFISSQRATFNRLVIKDSATFNGTISVNRIVVQESLSVNSLSLLSDLTAPSARILTLTARTASINTLLKARTINVVTTLNALSGLFTRGLGVNTTPPATGIRVSGNIVAKDLDVLDQFTLSSGTLNINGGTLFVGSTRPNKVGIGTVTPTAPLHVQFSGPGLYAADVNTSWQGVRIQAARTDINAAAGILLTTSTQTPSSSIGAGIAALRSNADSGAPGSHLIFISDPTTGTSAERMRITDAGNIGIGVTEPTAKLHVNGFMLVSGNVTANLLQVGTIRGIGSTVTINTNGILGINGRTSVNAGLILQNGLYLGRTVTPSAVGTLGRLFVSAIDSHLYFMRPGSSVPVNISLPLTGGSNHIPFFNSTGSLADSADLYWIDSTKTFQIGTRNALTKVAIVTTLNTQSSGNIALQQIRMLIPDRSNLSAQNTFTGLDINFAGDQGVGRLGDGETALGLKVDLRDVRARQSSIDGATFDGFKYGGLFLGGSVGVGTTAPQASLHVVGEVLGNYPLRIDTIRTANAFVVAPKGFVGVGTSAPDAQLSVRGSSNDATRPAFSVRTSANTSVLIVRNNGRVGIGNITNPTTALDVNGTIQATVGHFGSISGTTLNIGSGKFFVGANGRIGIGTTTPTGNISISKSINQSNAGEINEVTGYIAEKMDLRLAATGEAVLFNFTKPMTGYDINLTSETGSRLGGGATTVNAVGLDIDASALTLARKGRLVGLDVDVRGTGGTRYAAIFQGGRVGIGTTLPATDLHVSGDIRANSLILSGGLHVNRATYNRVTVTGLTTFTATVNAGLLQAKLISANRLNITGILRVPTASVTTLNISRFASAQSMAIGRSTVQSGFSLDVSGNMNVSRNLTVGSTLNVNTIQARTGSLIRLDAATVFAKSNVSANGIVKVGTGVLLKQNTLGAIIPADAARGALYVSSNGHLEYRRPGATTPLILSQALSGDAGKIPYYDNTGNLNDDAPIYWDNTLRRLKVGTANVLSTIQLTTSLNNSVTGNFIGQQIILGLGNRASVGGSTSKFTGLDILFRGQNSTSQFDFGRLAENETAIGLNVDVSSVRAKFSQSVSIGNDADRTGIKYAALFKGGAVGIGVSAPAAGLHVASEVAGRSVLRVDSFSRTNAFLVDSDGRVGVNTASPAAQLHITASSNTTGYVMQVVNSANASILAITNTSRIGIGTRNVQAALHIFSDPSPLRIDAGTDKQNSLFINGNGLVGMGTGVPSASLHVVGPSNADAFRVSMTGGPQYAMLIDSAGDVGIGISQPEFKLHVDGVIMSGTSNATHGFTSVPSWIRNKPDTTKGFLVNSGTANVFIGVRQGDTTDTIESVLFYQNDFSFQRRRTATANQTIMTLRSDGKIGMGTTLPIASLHVSGNRAIFIAGVGATPNAFVVTGNGRIGINTASPASLFHVNGALMANTIQITQGTVQVTTVNVSANLNVAVTANANKNVTAQAISVRINNDITQDVVGLDIAMKSNTDPSILPLGSRKYAIYNGGIAYGLRVDLRDVGINPLSVLNNNGNRFAATFLGGNVGIGVTNPAAALHVVASDPSNGNFNAGVDISRFATSQSDLTIRDYDNGQMGFIVRNLESSSTASNNYFPLSFAAGSPASANGPGFVGIGITNPDKTLVVNGDIRVGVLNQVATVPQLANYGRFLYFSGGPDMGGSSVDSDNSDPLFLARYNAAEDKSELRVNIGAGSVRDGDDKFLIGWTSDGSPSGQYNKIVDMRMDGRVGIGDTLASGFAPATVLHVVGTKSGSAETLTNHVAIIENKGSTDADSLAIYHSGTSNVGVSANFVTFFDTTGIVGKISGNGADGGVRFVSQGADYAEYLAKKDKTESIEKGDIVGVYNGQVTKKTAGAQHVMVKSSGASVAGNYPGEKGRSDFSLVAFFGQVKIKIVGPVNLGDFVVPSGREDGTGIAVSPDNIHRYAKSRIVGRAWEASSSQEMKLINTAVGFNFSMPELDKDFAIVHSLEKELKTLKAERQVMEKSINDRLEQQDKEIQRLMKQLKP